MTRVSDSAWKLGREHLLLARQSQAQGREDVCGEVFGRSRRGSVTELWLLAERTLFFVFVCAFPLNITGKKSYKRVITPVVSLVTH